MKTRYISEFLCKFASSNILAYSRIANLVAFMQKKRVNIALHHTLLFQACSSFYLISFETILYDVYHIRCQSSKCTICRVVLRTQCKYIVYTLLCIRIVCGWFILCDNLFNSFTVVTQLSRNSSETYPVKPVIVNDFFVYRPFVTYLCPLHLSITFRTVNNYDSSGPFFNRYGGPFFNSYLYGYDANLKIDGVWAWNFLYSYQFECFLGGQKLIKTNENIKEFDNVVMSIIQVSDTGFYLKDSIIGTEVDNFEDVSKSESILIFVCEKVERFSLWENAAYLTQLWPQKLFLINFPEISRL